MTKLEPIIRDLVYEEKIIKIEDLIEKIHSITGITNEKVKLRIEKLLENNKLYKFQKESIALQDFGDLLEEHIQKILSKIIYKEYIFKNPKLSNGNELCDLLIYFDDVLILIQAKTAKFEGNCERFIKKTITKSMTQLKSTINRCKRKDFKIELINTKNEKVIIKKDTIRKIIGIVTNYEIEPIVNFDKAQLTIQESLEKMEEVPHIFSIDEMKKVLNYFDTIPDFIDYLEKREKVVTNKAIELVTEEDIIGFYYRSNRTMLPYNTSEEEWKKTDLIYYDGFSEDLESGELKGLLQKRKEKDKQSLFIDNMIIMASECPEPENIEMIHRLHKLNRFQRRILGNASFEKYCSVIKTKQPVGLRFVHDPENKENAFVFVFSNYSRDKTRRLLENACVTAKFKHKIKEIIGIAQSPYDQKECNYDFLIDNRDYETHTDKNKKLEKLYPLIWGNTTKKHHFEEFE